MQYPSLRDYQNTIVNQNNFNIPFFQSESLEIFLNPRGYPFMFVGGFGAIFKFRDKNKREYAFKVFTRDVKDRAERYEALHKTLQITKFPFMADFNYVHEGFKVKGEPYPVVVMEWGRGLQLDAAIEQDLADDGIFQCAPHFAGNLFTIVKTLQEWNMGHNDLQEGNILVRDDNKLVLIDYDGMFVPLLKDEAPCEMGLRNYQHPERDKTHFNNKIDDFALVSILYQLSIITPELWLKLHDDRRLLLKEVDYKNPEQSELIQNGLKAEEPHARALAALLVKACSLHPLEINAIEKIGASPEITDWLVLPEKPDPMPDFKSVIEWALALKSGQVKEYEADQIESPAAEVEKIKAVKPRKEGAGRWKPLSEYMAAGKAAAAKVAQQRKATTPRPTTPKPPPKTVRSRVKPAPVTPPAPQKKSFFSKLVTFFTLLTALALSRIKLTFRFVVIAIALLTFATCACILIKLKPEKITHPRRSEPKPQVATPLKAQPEHEPKNNRVSKPKFKNSLGMEFVYIPPGEFMTASNANVWQHKVILSKGFYMQTTEVTQGQWKKIMGGNPSFFRRCGDDCPVESVSWYDVQKFIKKLNRNEKNTKYRLPTEAQWEYACRAGTRTPFAFGRCLSTDQANYNGSHPLQSCPKGKYRKKPIDVASLEPNQWGLYDMHGNVSEWCQDRDDHYLQQGTVTDPVGSSIGFHRILRGGSWHAHASFCRSDSSSTNGAGGGLNYIGVRLVMSLQAPLKPEPQEAIPLKAQVKKELTEPVVLTTKAVHEYDTSDKPRLVNSLGMEFVHIPPGVFMMGSPKYEQGRARYSKERLHKVILTKGFYMQTTEVTQGQWEKVMGKNPSSFKGCGDDCPVEMVSWNDTQKFIQKLNSDAKNTRYSLPTEAQWEYACRAGTQTPFAFGKCLSADQANYNGNPLSGCTKGRSRRKTMPVASFNPNAWGLYDMHGNVWEWCQDGGSYNNYPQDAVTDPVGPSNRGKRMRGGSWYYHASGCRSASRGFPSHPDDSDSSTGVRLVMSLPGQD
ncbi:SUMF1/EgtB/PvdO family nonheme iron enzyme [Desulfococcaceae bacterium HSG9]|nr:SUMF1/EgtB/PvdO family nonheme iron enzyme [Desulfococcaceae bacterium HSG9]